MKKTIISFLGVSLLLLAGCSPSVLIKKSSNPQNVVLSSFKFHIEHFNWNDLNTGNYASLLVSVSPRSMFNANLKQVYPRYNKQQNKLIKAEVDSTYTIIKNNLTKLNYNLLPANTLKGDAEYDPYGYPMETKQNKAFKKAKLALEVNVYVDQDFTDHFYAYPGMFQVRYTPRITMNMKMVDSSGKTVWSQQTVTLANSPVTIDNQRIGGYVELTVRGKPELADIINEAMDSMLKKTQPETPSVG